MLKYMSTNSIKLEKYQQISFSRSRRSHNCACVARQNVERRYVNTKIMSTNSRQAYGISFM